MKFFTALAALVVATVASATSPTFTNCATGSTDMTVTGFTLAPYPPCIGKLVCATVTGTLTAPITSGGPLTITPTFLGHKFPYSVDLCTALNATDNPCPIAITTNSITACFPFKSTAPTNINVALTVTAINGDGNTIFSQCGTITAITCST